MRAISANGRTGAWSQVVATNAQIGALQGIKVTEGIGQVFLEYAQPVDADFAGIRVWISTSSLFDLSDELVAYDGRDSLITLARLPNGSAFDPAVTYYLRAAGYGSFGRDGLVASSSPKFKVISMSVADGSITSTKIADNSITTPKLVSGSVTTDKLVADSVTADKINVTNLSAISANLGNITGGSLNINNRFVVNSDGSTTIRSATSGARMELNNSRLEVYDANNVLRVRLGIW